MGTKVQIVDKDSQPESVETSDYSKSRQGAFANLRYDLTDEDLKSPGVQKLLLNEIVRLENLELSLKGFKDKYHKIDKECAVLKESQRSLKVLEILYAVGLIIGALLLGLLPSVGKHEWILGGAGVVLILVSVIAKVIRK